LIKDSKKIRFEGNGYGDEWVKEAEKRGLNNFKDTPRALKAWGDKKYIKMFEELNVLTEREVEARQEIEFESYVMKIQIEARIMNDLTQTHIIPAVVEYQNKLLLWVTRLEKLLHRHRSN
jgi:glutamine synthetase